MQEGVDEDYVWRDDGRRLHFNRRGGSNIKVQILEVDVVSQVVWNSGDLPSRYNPEVTWLEDEPAKKAIWPDPTPEMLKTKEFDAIWECIKKWDINVPKAYEGYCGATGNHARAILDALKAYLFCPRCGCTIDAYKPELCAECEAEEKEELVGTPVVVPPSLSEFANWMLDNWYGNDLQIVSRAIQQFRETLK